MTLEEARAILEEAGGYIFDKEWPPKDSPGTLYTTAGEDEHPVVSYYPRNHSRLMYLEGDFTSDVLEALAVWMRHHAK